MSTHRLWLRTGASLSLLVSLVPALLAACSDDPHAPPSRATAWGAPVSGAGVGAAGTDATGSSGRGTAVAGLGGSAAGRVGSSAGGSATWVGGSAGVGGGAAEAGSSSISSVYMLGADLSSVPAAEAKGATFSDELGSGEILLLLRRHGFNYVRLRTFVDPKAPDGYDRLNGEADLSHTLAFGKRIKASGMGFLLDFHYSDNWADPGKQCVPTAWQGSTTIMQLSSALYDYTKDAITRLIAGGARPDVVQVGNEITSGLLLHVCDAAGQPIRSFPVNGSISNWSNLGVLLNAAVKGVRDVDPNIQTMLHIDRGGDKGGYVGDALEVSTQFIDNAQKQGVEFDLFGESCYQAYQGDPSGATNTERDWASTFGALAARFPRLRFVAAEYGPLEREINDVVFGLPNASGAGTFNWEPTQAGDWNTGHVLFTRVGNVYEAAPDLRLYDRMSTDYQGRL